MPEPPLPATGSVEVGVAASPEQIWRFVADPATPVRFSDELAEARLEGDGVMRLGGVIVGRNSRGDVTWETRSTVVECVEPRRLAWATGGADEPTATWAFEIREAPGGATLVHTVVLHDGREPFKSAIEREPDRAAEMVEHRMAELLDNMSRTVHGVANLAEGEARTARGGS